MQILKRVWSQWKKFTHALGVFQSRLILTLFYFIFLSPAGLIFRFTRDILGIQSYGDTSWVSKNPESETLEAIHHQ